MLYKLPKKLRQKRNATPVSAFNEGKSKKDNNSIAPKIFVTIVVTVVDTIVISDIVFRNGAEDEQKQKTTETVSSFY